MKNSSQQSALHLAVERKNFSIVKLLTEQQGDTNAQNKDGDTPLHCLLRNYNTAQLKQIFHDQKNEAMPLSDKKLVINIATSLIENGADLYLKNKKNQTPLDLCSDSVLNKSLSKKFKDISK